MHGRGGAVVDPTGVSPVLPTIGSSAGPGEAAARRVTIEDEILASWLDVLIADGLVPPRAVLGYPY